MQTIKSFLLNSRILLVLLVLVLFAGCSDDEGSTGEPGTLDRLFSYPAITSCGTCHTAGYKDTEGGPDLTTKENFRKNLINKSRDSYTWLITSADCSKPAYITPKSLEKSTLLAVISTDYIKESCGGLGYHDGLGSVNLTGSVLEDLEIWIRNGAKP